MAQPFSCAYNFNRKEQALCRFELRESLEIDIALRDVVGVSWWYIVSDALEQVSCTPQCLLLIPNTVLGSDCLLFLSCMLLDCRKYFEIFGRKVESDTISFMDLYLYRERNISVKNVNITQSKRHLHLTLK